MRIASAMLLYEPLYIASSAIIEDSESFSMENTIEYKPDAFSHSFSSRARRFNRHREAIVFSKRLEVVG